MSFTARKHRKKQISTDTENDFMRFCDSSTQPPEAVNSLHQSLPRYYLKDLRSASYVILYVHFVQCMMCQSKNEQRMNERGPKANSRAAGICRDLGTGIQQFLEKTLTLFRIIQGRIRPRLERTYKPHYHYQKFSPLANGTDLNRGKYAILQTHWH